MPSRRTRRPAVLVVFATCLLAAAACGDDPADPAVAAAPPPFDVLEVRIATDLPTITAGGSGTTVQYIFTNRTDTNVALSDAAGCLRFTAVAVASGGMFLLSNRCESPRAVIVPARSNMVLTMPFNGVIAAGSEATCALTGRVRLVAVAADERGTSNIMLRRRPGGPSIAEAAVTVEGTGNRPVCAFGPPGSRLASG